MLTFHSSNLKKRFNEELNLQQALSPIKNIYALMQCTPDLSSNDCNNCLHQNAVAYQQCCGQKQEGVVMRPSCFLRWDLYTYSKAFGKITVDSPPPQPPVTVPPPAGDKANTTDNDSKGISAGVVVAIAIATFVTVLILLVLGFCLFRSRKTYHPTKNESGITTVQYLQFDCKKIEAATDKFARSNKLGQGGYGEAFKGTLPNGIKVAVKRLLEKSAQGALECMNEVVLVAKLQHRNLVRLLGFCLEGVEKIHVYQFVPNKSLDYFLFDPTKQGQLDWTK